MGNDPWRRDCLGSSDAPAVAGVDPFRTAGDIWCEKTGRIPVDTSRQDTGDASLRLNPMTLGTAISPLLVAHAAEKLNRLVAGEVWYKHPTAPLACSVDGIAIDEHQNDAILIEAKTTGLIGPVPPQYAQQYGEDGTDEVPQSVIVQVHHAFAVLDAQPNLPPVHQAIVPALIGGRGIRCYRILRDNDLVDELLAMETDWWDAHVVGNSCPPDTPPSLEVLRRMKREADMPAREIDTTLVAEWQNAKAILKQAEANEETCRRFVLAELGDGEAGVCQIGRVTYKATQRAGYQVAPTIVRTLRFSPHGEGQRQRKVA